VRVEVRLHATLVAAAPGTRAGEAFPVDLPDDATLATLLDRLAIDPAAVHLVMIDGRAEPDHACPLADGARVALFPPVGGG